MLISNDMLLCSHITNTIMHCISLDKCMINLLYNVFFVDSQDCPDGLALTTSVPEQSEIDHSLALVVSKSSVYESD